MKEKQFLDQSDIDLINEAYQQVNENFWDRTKASISGITSGAKAIGQNIGSGIRNLGQNLLGKQGTHNVVNVADAAKKAKILSFDKTFTTKVSDIINDLIKSNIIPQNQFNNILGEFKQVLYKYTNPSVNIQKDEQEESKEKKYRDIDDDIKKVSNNIYRKNKHRIGRTSIDKAVEAGYKIGRFYSNEK